MDDFSTDIANLKIGLEIFCIAIKNVDESSCIAWKQIAYTNLEIFEKLPTQLNHCKFHLSQIAYNLITRLLTPWERFPECCPIVIKLLRALIKYEIDSATFQLLTIFLNDPEKYYKATLEINHNNQPLAQSSFGDQTSGYLEAPENFMRGNQHYIPKVLNPTEVRQDIRRKYNDYYSLCVLDLSGNFIICDENSRKIFGRAQAKLKGKNLFRDLMIPFSLAALRKKYEGDIFKLFDGKLSSVFSFTIYSSDNIDKYTKELVSKCQEPLRKNLSGEEFSQKKDKVEIFMSNLLKQLADEKSDAIYFKFLQNLTSKASLIDLQMTQTEIKELLSAGNEKSDIKVVPGSVLQELLAPDSELSDQIIRTVVLLETRKAKHIQNFPYHLMTQDSKITYWLSKYIDLLPFVYLTARIFLCSSRIALFWVFIDKVEKKLIDLSQKARISKDSSNFQSPPKKQQQSDDEEIYMYESPPRKTRARSINLVSS